MDIDLMNDCNVYDSAADYTQTLKAEANATLGMSRYAMRDVMNYLRSYSQSLEMIANAKVGHVYEEGGKWRTAWSVDDKQTKQKIHLRALRLSAVANEIEALYDDEYDEVFKDMK